MLELLDSETLIATMLAIREQADSDEHAALALGHLLGKVKLQEQPAKQYITKGGKQPEVKKPAKKPAKKPEAKKPVKPVPTLGGKRPHQGKPCKPGWSAARTGCIPKKKPAGGPQSKLPEFGGKPELPDGGAELPPKQRAGKAGGKMSVKETANLLQNMIEYGKVTRDSASHVARSLMSYNNAELREIAQKLGLDASGRPKVEKAKLLADEVLLKGGLDKGKLDEAKGKLGDKKPGDWFEGGEGAGKSPKEGREEAPAKPVEPDNTEADEERKPVSEPAGGEVTKSVPARIGRVNARIDKYEQFFREQGSGEQADWMKMLKEHINSVGVDAALDALGEEVTGAGEERVQYEGGWEDMPQFCEDYLNRVGITPIFGKPKKGTPTVSSVSPAHREGKAPKSYAASDFFPTDPTFTNKLQEAKHLPGLETSEDLGVLMGKQVKEFTPDVVEKLDATYGKDGWIVKAYGDEAFAGYGIFFPQRVRQLPQEARNTIWSAGEQLAKYGFSLERDKKNYIIGLKHSDGKLYKFGSKAYEDTLFGDVRDWGDKVEELAEHEHGCVLPGGGKDFMAQPAFPVVGVSEEERARGVTGAEGGKGEGRVHIVTRNGKAEIVPHSTWIKGENLPVVFENDDTNAMAQAALDAINALPESERKNQIYAPDIVRTSEGYKVIEANPANETGSSGYLGDNPMVIDSYVSHLTGREPAHVKFIRRLLTDRKKQKVEEKPVKKPKQPRKR